VNDVFEGVNDVCLGLEFAKRGAKVAIDDYKGGWVPAPGGGANEFWSQEVGKLRENVIGVHKNAVPFDKIGISSFGDIG
jgi:hypothetical protein